VQILHQNPLIGISRKFCEFWVWLRHHIVTHTWTTTNRRKVTLNGSRTYWTSTPQIFCWVISKIMTNRTLPRLFPNEKSHHCQIRTISIARARQIQLFMLISCKLQATKMSTFRAHHWTVIKQRWFVRNYWNWVGRQLDMSGKKRRLYQIWMELEYNKAYAFLFFHEWNFMGFVTYNTSNFEWGVKCSPQSCILLQVYFLTTL